VLRSAHKVKELIFQLPIFVKKLRALPSRITLVGPGRPTLQEKLGSSGKLQRRQAFRQVLLIC
jgi:hypothetical protein